MAGALFSAPPGFSLAGEGGDHAAAEVAGPEPIGCTAAGSAQLRGREERSQKLWWRRGLCLSVHGRPFRRIDLRIRRSRRCAGFDESFATNRPALMSGLASVSCVERSRPAFDVAGGVRR